MKTIINILIFFLIQFSVYSQVPLLTEIIEINPSVDSLNNRIVKSLDYDSSGNLISLRLNYFQNLDSKFRSKGHWIYFYNKDTLIHSILIERDKGDTIKENYEYIGNSVWLTQTELITESKIKDGYEYGLGTTNGCIVPPEAIEYYKKWIIILKMESIYNENKLTGQTYLEYFMSPHELKYQYDKDGDLVKVIEICLYKNIVNWEENIQYSKDSIVRKRDYFITYSDIVPSSEYEIKYLDSNGLITKIVLKNSKDRFDGIIENEYENGLLKSQTLYNLKGTFIRKLIYKYTLQDTNKH